MAESVIKHRFLWEYFIVDTERWLDTLAGEGLHIKSIDLARSRFEFMRGKPRLYRYCFSFQKFPSEAAGRENFLKKNGWERVYRSGRWSLYRTRQQNEIGILPNRRGIYLRNNSLLLLYNIFSFILLLGLFLGTLALLQATVPSADVRFFRRFLSLILVFAVLIVGNFLIFLRLTAANNAILEEFSSAINPEYAIYHHFLRSGTFESWLEKLLIQGGDIVRGFRPLWLIAPDRFTRFLEKQEAAGIHLYRIGNLSGVLYFVHGNPRRMKYQVVSGSRSTLEDTRRFLEDGWNIAYSSPGQLWKIMLLAREYEDAPPLLFKTVREYRSNARGIAAHQLLIALTLFLFALLAAAFGLRSPGAGVPLFAAALLFVICVWMLCTILFYLLRVRKNAAAFPSEARRGR
jgi:hypothetical protein